MCTIHKNMHCGIMNIDIKNKGEYTLEHRLLYQNDWRYSGGL